MAARKPKPWAPPAGLKVEICVSRGDVYFKAESTPADLLNVARMLTVTLRQLTADAPDLLPHADTVPGSVLPYDWTEELDASKTLPPQKRLGFTG